MQTPDLEQPFYPAKQEDDQSDGGHLGNAATCELNADVVHEIILDHL